MKSLYPSMRSLCALLVLAVLIAPACKKDSTPPTETPEETVTPVVAFTRAQYGCYDLWRQIVAYDTNTVSVTGPGAAKFTYEVSSSNGLRTAADTIIKGSGVTGGNGKVMLALRGLFHYNDGALTIKVHFDGATDTITATTLKEEFIIRDYKDLSSISYLHDLAGRSPSDHYVQAQDIAFPDTVFTKAPIRIFYGAYDGNGHKITNLTITPAAQSNGPLEFLGLFGYLAETVVIRNVRLELSDAGINTPNYAHCGGIAGVSEGGTIINCAVKGTLKGGDNSKIGGIVGDMSRGRMTGCSFNGSLEGYTTGGLIGILNNGYVNMCYSNFAPGSTLGGGLVGGFPRYDDTVLRDTVLNSYAYIREPQVTYLFSLFYHSQSIPFLPFLHENCFSNNGATQGNVIMYSSVAELNARLATLEVSALPEGITAPPGNRPFRITTSDTQPATLWWE